MGSRRIAIAVAGGLAGLASLFALTAQAKAECSLDSVWECTPPPTEPLPLPTTTTTPPPPPLPDAGAVAARLFVLVNGERTGRGLAPLSRRADVDAIARLHGERMAAAAKIWHNDDYFTQATKRSIGASFVGENVAKNMSVEDMHRRLMNSPHHRDNILDGRFTQVGIGVGVAPSGELFATEDFLTPTAPAPAPAAAPVSVRPAPSTTTTSAPAPAAAAGESFELALPGPMDMAGVSLPDRAAGGRGGGRSAGFLLWCLAAVVAIGAPLRVGFSRYRST